MKVQSTNNFAEGLRKLNTPPVLVKVCTTRAVLLLSLVNIVITSFRSPGYPDYLLHFVGRLIINISNVNNKNTRLSETISKKLPNN